MPPTNAPKNCEVEYNPIAKPRLSSVAILSFVAMLPIIILAEKFPNHKAMILVAITIMIISQILFYQTSLTYLTFSTLLTLFFIAFNAMFSDSVT
jgi:hypothetical protein